MKTTIKLLTLALVLFATACNNDDEMDMLNSLWRNVTQNEARIDALEKWCAQANTNISSLQTIVNVFESNDAITSITPVMEGGVEIGYTITFSNHDPITIYHGKDGKDGQNGANGQNGTSPIVGVAKYTDGVYYWTLNGEWLLDADGNKLPVSGKDGVNGENGQNGSNGQNGVTPQLKIENDYWWISYDNGSTWTQLGKAKGEDGQNGAKGDKGDTGDKGDKGDKGDAGDSMFQSVTQDADNVYFTLADGTVIKIAKGNSSSENRIEGQLNGVFSVSKYVKVNFSQGNLLYNPALDVWKFADKQNISYNRDYTSVSQNSNIWIDLFLWGATGYLETTPFGANIPIEIRDKDLWFISASNFDYGVYCPIENGGNELGLWRTLTKSEWLYLLNDRENASSLRTIGFVNNIEGLILLPDTSTLAINNPNILVNGLKYTDDTWSDLESNGCIFLPYTEYYWTSDAYVSVEYYAACSVHTFRGNAVDCRNFLKTTPSSNDCEHVRLVRDCKQK